LCVDLGDGWGIARCLNRLGEAALDAGDYERAEMALTDALSLRRANKDEGGLGISLAALGRVLLLRGDYDRAASVLRECLPVLDKVGSRAGRAGALRSLAVIARITGDLPRAAALNRETLTITRAIGDRRNLAAALEGLAGIAEDQQSFVRGARLAGAASKLRDLIHAPIPLVSRDAIERDLARARATLGEEAFAAAWVEGQAMTLEQAVAYALEEPPA
jgi:tetratricopeptide (TPR) repeat protein